LIIQNEQNLFKLAEPNIYMKGEKMEEKEFRKNYEGKLKKFGYKFDDRFENEDYKALSYKNNKKDSLIVVVLSKENKGNIASLLYFDGMQNKAKYDVSIDELFEFLEKEA
jgi:hypothetical protein